MTGINRHSLTELSLYEFLLNDDPVPESLTLISVILFYLFRVEINVVMEIKTATERELSTLLLSNMSFFINSSRQWFSFAKIKYFFILQKRTIPVPFLTKYLISSVKT